MSDLPIGTIAAIHVDHGNGCVPQQVIMALNSMRAARSINEGETK